MISRRHAVKATLLSTPLFYACNATVPKSLLKADSLDLDDDYGVASGEPEPDGVILWTRVPKSFQAAAGSTEVVCQVATTSDFTAASMITTLQKNCDGGTDHAVRIKITGLAPATTYFYRFTTSSGYRSVTGRTRTAPAALAKDPVKFAVVSCQDFTKGYFLAYQAILAGEFDFILHLGDFIYEKGGKTVRTDDIGGGVATTLDHYRTKYKLYLTDPHLREARRLFPFVHLWDDHEVENNYSGPAFAEDNSAKMMAGYRAFFEFIPVQGEVSSLNNVPSAPMTRSLRFGSLVELFALDQRQFRDKGVCKRDLVAPRCDAILEPKRTMLGEKQSKWLMDKMAASSATWKVIASELMFMPVRTPKLPFIGNQAAFAGGGLEGLDEMLAKNPGLMQQFEAEVEPMMAAAMEQNPVNAAAAAVSAEGGAYLTLDSWDGYPAERRLILDGISKAKIKDVLVCSGDIHNFFAGKVHRVPEDGKSPVVASELTTSSVTSKGISEVLGKTIAKVVRLGITPNNRHIQKFDLRYHGYTEIVVAADTISGRMVALESIATMSGKPFVLTSFGTRRGVPGFSFK